MEAVTTRSSIVLVTLAFILATCASASATAPLPTYEQSRDVPDMDWGYVQGDLTKKREFGPYCIRTLFCVGPLEPVVDQEVPATGFRVVTEDVHATAGHDPARKERFGPYALPTLILGDDLRICYTGCYLHDGAYAHAVGNVTVFLYVWGETYSYGYSADQSFDSLYPEQIPRTHCEYAQKHKTQC